MSKRASNRSSHNAPKSKRINIPYECLVCQTDITNNSVLFHCDCIVVICQECAILQVAAQRSTYLDGLLCPYCRRPSYNIQNIEKAKTEENALIEDAFNHLKLRPSRSNEAIKRAINAMIALGFKSSLTAEELNSEVINSPEYLPTIKLELARLQLERNSRVSNSSKSHSNDLMPLPLGPLKYLTFTRNHILERALVVTVTTSNVTSVIQGGTINAETIIPMIQKPECRSVACQTMESSFEVVNASSTSHHDDLQDHDSEPFHKLYETAPNHSAESYQLEGRSPQAPQMKNPKYASKKTQQNAIQAQIAQKQFMQQQAYYNHIMMSRAAGSGRQSAGHLPSQAASGNGNSREQYQASQGGYAGMNEAAVMGHLSGARAHSTTSSNSAPTYANNFAYGAGRPARSQPPAHQIRSTDHPSYYIGSKKIFCVCQKPASPEYYIRCCIGVGKCNGWVHPACCMDLAFKTPHELAYIESRGYSCFLCNHMVSIANSTANKRPRSDEMYLQHVGSSHKRESSYPNHNLGSKSSQRTEFPGGRTNFANVSAHAQFKARMTASGSSSQTNFTQAAFTEGSIDAMNLEGTHWQVQVSGYNHDGTPLTVGSESQQSELNTSAASSSVTAGHSKHDNEILQWMITMVQTLPILVNRTIPGKDVSIV